MNVRVWCVALGVTFAMACADTLPAHDNRIFTAVPVVKLSATDLVRAFADDEPAARRRFVGEAIEVSGVVRDLQATTPPTFLLHAGESGRQVHISLHEDRAAGAMKTIVAGQRITLRCFCEALAQHVQLKSCVVP